MFLSREEFLHKEDALYSGELQYREDYLFKEVVMFSTILQSEGEPPQSKGATIRLQQGVLFKEVNIHPCLSQEMHIHSKGLHLLFNGELTIRKGQLFLRIHIPQKGV